MLPYVMRLQFGFMLVLQCRVVICWVDVGLQCKVVICWVHVGSAVQGLLSVVQGRVGSTV